MSGGVRVYVCVMPDVFLGKLSLHHEEMKNRQSFSYEEA